MEKNIIIVGQGIAGTVLAENFLQRGFRVIIFDEVGRNNASRVAAGVYNPIIAKRLTTTWMAEELITTCIEFYHSFGSRVNKNLIRSLPVYMLFDSIAQQNDWAAKSREHRFSSWIKTESEVNTLIYQPYGGQWFEGSGALDTNGFLDAFISQEKSSLCYMSEVFESTELIETGDKIIYKNWEADYIFFCEGARATENRFFREVPFSPAKGEVLTIKIPNFKIDYIIQSGIYILPIYDDVYRVGATYEWKELNETPTQLGKEELVEKTKKVIPVPFELIDHRAGIRPAIKDRRPVIGLHPLHKRIGIFNGLGTKGVLLAPYFAKQLVDYIELKTDILPEVDVKRFY